MSRTSKGVIAIAALIILCNYYYIYFLGFSQGVVSGGGGYSYIRLIGLFLLFSQIVDVRSIRRPTWRELFFVAFIILSALVACVKFASNGVGDKMVVNAIVCAVPLLVFNLCADQRKLAFFMDCCLVILVAQVAGDWLIYSQHEMLWENAAFIGGVGNPSSFGLILCVFSAYVMLCKTPGIKSYILIVFLQLAVVRTSALMPVILMIAIAGYCMIVGRAKLPLIGTSLTIFFSLAASRLVIGDHLIFKINSLVYSLSGYRIFDSVSGVSISVSLRAEAIREIVLAATSNPLKFFLMGNSSEWYRGIDSQVLTYLSSFGLLCTLLFFAYVLMSIYIHWVRPTGQSKFIVAVLLLFCGIFLTNRILDYYPVALFFFLATAQSSENVSRRQTSLG